MVGRAADAPRGHGAPRRRRGGGRRPAARAWWCSTPPTRWSVPPSCGTTRSRRPTRRWLVQAARGAAAWAAACGSVPVAAFTIAKLSWLHRSEPDAWARLARVCLPHDWLTLRLIGRVRDRSRRRVGHRLLHRRARTSTAPTSSRSSTANADWSAAVPRCSARPPCGHADEFGTARSSRPAPATTWRPRSASALRPGDVAISIGTSGTVFAVSESPTADASGAVAGFADATGRFLPLVCTLNATKVTDAMARLLGVDHDGLDALALAAPAGRRWAHARAVLRRRAHARPARRDRACRRAAFRRDARTARRAPRSKASCAVCSTASTRSPRRASGRAAVSCSSAAAARSARLPASRRRPRRPAGGRARRAELVATGACVQAAAVFSSRDRPTSPRSGASVPVRRSNPAGRSRRVRARYAEAAHG